MMYTLKFGGLESSIKKWYARTFVLNNIYVYKSDPGWSEQQHCCSISLNDIDVLELLNFIYTAYGQDI